ncbi:MAG: DUF2232 domain-containing protein [Clostridia bacterium]|nr:DUF2232 domain-containing protein [Clostridia bacterium]
MKRTNYKIIYPFVGTVCAAGGTVALLSRGTNPGALFLWLFLLFAANLFIAAGIVCGAREETVEIPNPKAFREGEPKTVTSTLRRIPALSIVLALGATAVVAGLTYSVLDSLLTLFTWGALSYPLARCILNRTPFGASMQSGLISASVLTLLAGVVHVFKVAPDHTFRLQYAYDLAVNAVRDKILPLLTEAKEILLSQPIADPLLTDFSPEQTANWMIESLLSFLPALFAIAALFALCLLWWLIKWAVSKDDSFPVRHMGRLDNYSPSRVLFIVYMASFLLYMISEEGSIPETVGMNLTSVTSAILAFAGFSLVLFVINTRATSKFARIGLSVLTLILGFDSCGYQALTLAGLFSSDNLRQFLGGGTYK